VRSAPATRPTSGQPAATNLPDRRTSFVGRARELEEVRRALAEARLVSLTGAGGCGKTSLAVEAARHAMSEFPDGAWLAELAPISDAALVPSAVAAALNILDEPGRSFSEVLAEFLGRKRLLLVLDNCEHLLEAAADLCDELLRRCPAIRILVTSRQILGVEGEWSFSVPPLGLPPEEADAAAVTSSEAGKLFLHRARAVARGVEIDQTNATAVASICRRLDGMPLAIELAAARVGLLTPGEIDERLDDRFRLLRAGTRTAARHRTLGALIDWSHDLLNAEEAVLYRRLGVFVGGFALEAAEQVCSGQSLARDGVLELLGQLLDKSLVAAEDQEGHTRYRMLETIREHALQRLRASGEEDELRSRHLGWVVSFLERSDGELAGPRQAETARRMEREFANVRAAFTWSLASGDVEEALCLVGVHRFWRSVQGHGGEGRGWVDAALAAPGAAAPSVRAEALAQAADFCRVQGDLDGARSHAEQCLSIQRELQDPTAVGRTLYVLGRVESAAGRDERAQAVTQESVAIARATGERQQLGERLSQLGEITYDRGEPERARPLADEALGLARAAGDTHTIADALRILGMIERDTGHAEEARSRLGEALSLHRELSDWTCASLSLSALGELALRARESTRAGALFAESLALQRKTGVWYRMVDCLWGLAAAAAGEGRLVRAARLLGAEERFRGEAGIPFRLGSAERHDAVLAALRQRMGAAAFAAARREGLAMEREAVVDYALATYEPGAAPADALASGPVAGRFRLDGDSWDIAYAGKSLRLRDAKGLRYLHRLLSHPGRELHVAELLLPAASAAAKAKPDDGSITGLGDAGELLDPRAKAEYRRRVQDLREEIQEAAQWGDDERRARAEEELEFLSRELAAAFGLSGRARRAADISERIRKAVSNRIRDTLARIAREHPSLGRHLSNAISTGTYCSYRPEQALDWEL
jgi:predicted ATPase/tetratricopeptide (TPR) repeat protein